MKTERFWGAWVVLGAAVGVSAAAGLGPEAQFLRGFRTTAGDAAKAAFEVLETSQVRNKAYSVIALNAEVQKGLARQQAGLSAAAAAPQVRQRVLRETKELLEDLSREANRLAGESRDPKEFADSLGKLSGHVAGWADGSLAAGSGKAGRVLGNWPPTEDNIEGPFYRPNAPMTTRLFGTGDKGELVMVSGRVLDTDGSPVAGALLDVWLANSKGEYDIDSPNDRGNTSIPLKWRGRMRTDGYGNYKFEAILPGQYEIGENKWRPKHIHFKVSASGRRSLTTQMYFVGDSFNESDTWWKPSLTAPLTPAGQGSFSSSFDFVLKRQTP